MKPFLTSLVFNVFEEVKPAYEGQSCLLFWPGTPEDGCCYHVAKWKDGKFVNSYGAVYHSPIYWAELKETYE